MPIAVVTTRGREASLKILTEGFTPLGPTTMILIKSGHNFQQETDTVADVAGDELVATGYVRQLVFFKAFGETVDGAATQQTTITTFGVVGGAVDDSVGGCYLYWNSGDDATSIIHACVPFIASAETDGTELVIQPVVWIWEPPAF